MSSYEKILPSISYVPSFPYPLLEPSSTILRIRRKRGAEPVAGLVVSKRSKIAINESSTENHISQEKKDVNESEKNIIFR